jgi:hypothetical protein
MTKIILHLGLHKTGTTFLQTKVFPNIINVNLMSNKHELIHYHLDEEKINIISEERFSLSVPYFQDHYCDCSREEVLDHLKNLFPNAKVIVGIRDKEPWLKSCYSEYIKGGWGSLKYDDFLEHYKQDIIDMDDYVNRVKERWKDVYVYRQERLTQELKELCEFIGCNIPDYDKRRKNVSLTRSQISAMRFINRFLENFVNPFFWKYFHMFYKKGHPTTINLLLLHLVNKLRGK